MKRFSIIFSLWVAAVLARADVNFTTSVDKTEIAMGDFVQLTLRFDDVGVDNPPQLPPIDGFNVAYSGRQSMAGFDNGRVSQAILYIFQLTPTRDGTLVIPNLTIQLGGKTISSQSHTIKVSKGGDQGVNVDDLFQLKMSVSRQELFLNEVVPVDVKIYLRNGVRHGPPRRPTIAADGFADIALLSQFVESQEVIQGKSFLVYTLRTLAKVVRTGELTLGPAQTEIDTYIESQGRRGPPGFDSSFFAPFFGAGETKRFAVVSKPLKITVRPLPDAGKPADFTGAVGKFILDVSAKPTALRAGEPVTLTITVKGEGNLASVSPPKFTAPEGFKSYEPVLKNKRNDELGFTTEKTFEQVIVPQSARATQIPPITFSFFNPEQRRYETLSRGPIKLTVQESPGGAVPLVVGIGPAVALPKPAEKLGSSIVYLKPDLGVVVTNAPALYLRGWFIVMQGVPALALIGFWLVQRHHRRLQGDMRYARARRAHGHAQQRLAATERLMRGGDPRGEFFATLFSALQEYLGDKLNLPSSGITSSVVDEQLRPRQAPADVCEALNQLFAACDTAKFAPQMQTSLDRERALQTAREIIAALEKMPL